MPRGSRTRATPPVQPAGECRVGLTLERIHSPGPQHLLENIEHLAIHTAPADLRPLLQTLVQVVGDIF
jgi:hypothetical protein